ncbi:MAG: DUF58 domain-containing protein [Spirochaetia bacterium]
MGNVKEVIKIRLHPQSVYVHDEAVLESSAKLPGFMFPGTFSVLAEELTFADTKRTLRITNELKPGRNTVTTAFTPQLRGEYSANELILSVSSPAGLTRVDIRFFMPVVLNVMPRLEQRYIQLPDPGTGGNVRPQRKNLTRNDELYEVRKYFPGDDIRRINWKLFAHVGELFLRIGEEDPPPEAKVLCVLDLRFLMQWYPPNKRASAEDRIVLFFAELLMQFEEQGMDVSAQLLTGEAPVAISQEGTRGLMEALSGITAKLQNTTKEDFSKDADRVVIVSTPSKHEEYFLPCRLGKRKSGDLLFPVNLRNEETENWIKKLFFPEDERLAQVAMKPFANAASEAVSSVNRRYPGLSARVVHDSIKENEDG